MSPAERSRIPPAASSATLLLVAIGVGLYAVARARDVLLANHDIGWFLHAGGVWLDGGKIGADVIDTNPPLVIWLSGLEVGLARALGASPFVVHAIATCGVALLGVVLASRAFRRAGVPDEALALWAPLTLVVGTAVAGYEFGQREHWISYLLLPYAGWALVPREAAVRSAITLERVLAGFLAALAVALKPHFLLAVAVIEAFGAARSRSARTLLRVEVAVAVACAPLYLLAVQLSAPQFWTDLRDTLAVYGAYGHEVPLWSRHAALALAALALAAPAGLLRPRSSVPALLAALALCSAVAAWLQHKDFAYHHIPTGAFAGSALALASGLLVARVARGTAAALALLGVTLAGCLACLAWLPREPRDAELRESLLAHVEELANRGSVFVFTSAVGAAFPTLQFGGARSVSPYSCLWPVAGNYTEEERAARPFPYRSLAQMTAIERRLVERVTSVLARERPDLLVFDRRPFKAAFGRTAFDFQRYLEADPDFVAFTASYRSLARDSCFEYYGRSGG